MLLSRARVERFLVEAVIVRDDQHPVAIGEGELSHGLGRLGEHAPASRKPLRGVQVLAVVDDGHLEAERSGGRGSRPRDVARTEDEEPLGSLDWLHEHLHPAPAAHTEVAPEIADEDVRSPIRDALRERVDHGLLDRSAADRADRASVGEEHEPRAGLLGRRAGCADHGRERASRPALEQLDQRVGDILHQEKRTLRRAMAQRSVTSFDVSPAEDGWRLDRAVHVHLGSPTTSRADARGLIERGAVRVNGQRVDRSSARVRAGDRVEIAGEGGARGPTRTARHATVELEASAIVYEDDWMIVVDKPAGLPSHGTRDASRDHLVAAVTRLVATRDGRAPSTLRAAHRLDADTSGLLVLGKTAEATRALSEAFASRNVEKVYAAVVHSRGQALPDAWSVEDHLAWSKRDERMRRVRSGGDYARTDFVVRERGATLALVEARPRTGRTHQIRVHLEGSGAPIAGDRIYGTRDGASRLLLHATRLELAHPITGAPLVVEIAPPPELAHALGPP